MSNEKGIPKVQDKCNWKYEYLDINKVYLYKTSCNRSHVSFHPVKELFYKYCMFCSGKIILKDEEEN